MSSNFVAREMIQAEVGLATVRLFSIREGWLAAHAAISLSHEVETRRAALSARKFNVEQNIAPVLPGLGRLCPLQAREGPGTKDPLG